MLKTCVRIDVRNHSRTHAVYIHAGAQDVDGGSGAEQGIMLLRAQLSTEGSKT